MPDHTDLLLLRRRAGRWTALAGAVLAMSLSSPGPAAHAGDGELLDDVTGAAGTVTEPVVDPVLEAIETVVPPVEQAVEPVVEDVVEPTVTQVEDAVQETTGGDRGAPSEGAARSQAEHDPGDRPDSEPVAQAAEPVTSSQPAPATPATTPTGQGSSHATGQEGPGDGPGAGATDRPRGGRRAVAASCDGVDGLPPRGAAAPVVRDRDVRDAEVAGSSRGDGRPDDRSDGARAFVLPGPGGPAPALVEPDPVRTLWLTGLVALVMMLTAGLTVVLVRELE
ncbi:hypothetical protein EXE59_14200 [Nocardioides eburneiflavus]|uniref:Uncharacterized protein n=1 Tax=Nocardioides eburneiflavus TaxID=2518372 RepID=A0A4Z1CBK0_9ACTN|nr:hypothetical protein [Nocardioides eburneiflavus]TGN64986.1 hypothetical protein EXE59_14200 [Nocardioides eburneiflavus]